MNVLILPTQLFAENKLITKSSIVYLYEHPVYFTMYPYHKLKLILHRATMKSYYDYLKEKCQVHYIEFFDTLPINKYHMYDPVDFEVTKSLAKLSTTLYETPSFLTDEINLKEFSERGTTNHNSFYIWQRRRLNILVSGDKPVGGKWSFDKSNRSPFPKNYSEPTIIKQNNGKYVSEAKKYVEKHFSKNIGSTEFYLPVNHSDAKKHLDEFVKHRFLLFGKYEDAVGKNIVLGNHSLLSPMLNIGLLTPDYIVKKVLKYSSKINLESLEGFIRQIIGWREYSRFIYITKHKKMISSNYFKHNKKLSDAWFTAELNIEPIDDIIRKTIKYAYAHHIERLMYLGNLMLLLQIKPKQVHDWFMIMFIDSYHVFMEPNVYGMSQFSAGPIMMTRPYFSSSNYIIKMSDYKKGEWCKIFDALYYNFINNNISVLSKNYSTATAVYHWNNKSSSEKKRILALAKLY